MEGIGGKRNTQNITKRITLAKAAQGKGIAVGPSVVGQDGKFRGRRLSRSEGKDLSQDK